MADLEQVTGDDSSHGSTNDSRVSLCGGCTVLDTCRLGLKRENLLADGSSETHLLCGIEHEGGPDVAHGGWTAAIFDEVLGHLLRLHGQLAVTGQLCVKFARPVPVGRPLLAVARIDGRSAHRWFVSAELTLLSAGAVLGTAEAVMVIRDTAHFDRHRQWLADQDEMGSGPS